MGRSLTISKTALGSYYFPGPIASRRGEELIEVEQIASGGGGPAVYLARGLYQANWKAAWRGVAGDGRCFFVGPAPRGGTAWVTVVFQSSGVATPLALCGRLVEAKGGRFTLWIPRTGLSWRLAAVAFGRRLPAAAGRTADRSGRPAPAPRRLLDWRVTISASLAGAATTIAPPGKFAMAIRLLRSGHHDIDEVLALTGLSAAGALPFFSGLWATEIIDEVCPPLTTGAGPFAMLGLHWSASDHQVKRNFRALRQRLATDAEAPLELRQSLDEAYFLLRQRHRRELVRAKMIAAPTRGEAVEALKLRLERALIGHQQSWIVDLSRRILELTPADQEIRNILEYHR